MLSSTTSRAAMAVANRFQQQSLRCMATAKSFVRFFAYFCPSAIPLEHPFLIALCSFDSIPVSRAFLS
jgi:hypothetical protein